jgi:SSS family solute:Na+ symporter
LGAGFLKLLIPFLTISTGVAAAHLFNIRFKEQSILPDDAFLYLVDAVIPKIWGLTGLLLAGVAAAVFSTIDAMMNATSTLFTIDIYKKYLRPNATDADTLKIGRLTVVIMAVLASSLAIITYSPNSADNFFLTVSSRGSYFTPGIIVAFFGGILFKRATAKGALLSIISAPLFSFFIEYMYNDFLNQHDFFVAFLGEKLNFLHRVFLASVLSFLVFLLCLHNQSVEDNTLSLSFKNFRSIFVKSGIFISGNLVLAIYTGNGFLYHQYIPYIAAIFAFITFMYGFSFSSLSQNYPKIFASLLIATTTFILYWFW